MCLRRLLNCLCVCFLTILAPDQAQWLTRQMIGLRFLKVTPFLSPPAPPGSSAGEQLYKSIKSIKPLAQNCHMKSEIKYRGLSTPLPPAVPGLIPAPTYQPRALSGVFLARCGLNPNCSGITPGRARGPCAAEI